MEERRWRAYKQAVRDADLLVQVLDARDPAGTFNWTQSKYKSKLIVVLNKADLAPRGQELPEKIAKYRPIPVSAKTGRGLGELAKAIREKAPGGASVLFTGYPNVGKSSLVNRLSGRGAARVSPIPGETRGLQNVSARGFTAIDTPGMVPKGNQGGKALVLKGAIRADKIPDPEPIACEILCGFIENKPSALRKLYDIEVERGEGVEEVIARIARRRGKLLKGGELNYYETAKMVIRDYQLGRLALG
jgi:ribosome biogenesis GTPase A